MTEAEKKLLELALAYYNPDSAYPVTLAARDVLLERLPPEYESTLRQLVVRFVDACDALNEYENKHPMGSELSNRMREEYRASKCKP